MKDKFYIILRLTIILFFLALIFLCVGIKIYVIIKYAAMPIAQVPTWAYIWLQNK
jgi:hypothetical protein